jgi:CDP-diacylglycerol--glycerol-3-phosphate 3-phosphatidyltransferase
MTVTPSQRGQAGHNQVPLLNIANILTISRLLCVPILVWLMLIPGTVWTRLLAAAVFLAASLTDLVDGKLARSRGLVTDFGRLADPIADKALVLSALVLLSWSGQVPWWVTIVIGIREIAVTVLRLAASRRSVLAADRWGKTKTVTQIVAITMLLVSQGQFAWWSLLCWIALGLALILTVVTGVVVCWRAIAVLADPGPAQARQLITTMHAHGLTLATAESLTAGQVSATLATVPGCSAVLRGGVVAYATDVKIDVLRLSEQLCAHVVSQEVAEAMAQRACDVLGADLGLATTGVAGPDPLDDQPPGTVWIAVHDHRSGRTTSHVLEINGSRARVRRLTTQAVLRLAAGVVADGAGEYPGSTSG